MKKLIFILFIISGIALTTNAQSHFQLGLKLGYNSTSFNTDNGSSILSGLEGYNFSKARDDFRSGYLIGAYSRIGLIGNLSLQPEFYFTKKSGVTDFYLKSGSTDVAVSEKVSYYSWDLPILAHLKVVDLKIFNLYGVAGPVASFKVNDKSKFSSLNNDLNNDKLRSTNWNFQLGAGVEVWKLNLDVRYEWGLNDVSKTQLERKSNALMFTLGYRFIGL